LTSIFFYRVPSVAPYGSKYQAQYSIYAKEPSMTTE
jgi:hypothetical protein